MSMQASIGAGGLFAVTASLFFASPGQAQDCPDQTAYGTVRHLSAEQLARRPLRLPIPAGGDLNLANCTDVPGIGYVTEGPDLSLRLTSNPNGRRLDFRVESECDSVMLVNSPRGRWLFDDDNNGNLDPAISVNRAISGWWDVWLGRLADAPGTCNAELVVRALPAQQARAPWRATGLQDTSYRK